MSLKGVTVTLFMMLVSCYCEGNTLNEELTVDEGRAKKKKSNLRIWGVLLLLIVGKLAVEKLLAALFLWGSFQKFCYLAGLAISYFMSAKPSRPASKPSPEPINNDYNTLGYSYGPPDHGFGGSSAEQVGGNTVESGSYGAPAPLNNWPYNRRSLNED